MNLETNMRRCRSAEIIMRLFRSGQDDLPAMPAEERSVPAPERPESLKRPYVTPLLIAYGTVAQLAHVQGFVPEISFSSQFH